VSEPRLTASEWATMLRSPTKDKRYQDETGLGPAIRAFLAYFESDFGATRESQRDYEAILAKLALHHADESLEAFDVPHGTQKLREFMATYWGDRSPRTRKKVRSVLVSFLDFHVGEGALLGNAARPLRTPKQRGVERGVFQPHERDRLIASQPRHRDRLALGLLFALALRKSELAAVQFKHFDYGRRRLKVFGKGQTVYPMPVPPDLLDEVERYTLGRNPDEFLLYPEKVTGQSLRWNRLYSGIIWETRDKPKSPVGMHRWWKGCLERAGLSSERKMHEARHTAITDFLRQTENLKLTQQFARHASIQTTADVYAHLDDMDLERAMQSLWSSDRLE
jgi:integrase